MKFNDDPRIIEDTEKALFPLLADPGIFTGRPEECTTEVGKRALEIYFNFEEQPQRIKGEDLKKLIESEGSQIGNKDDYFGHITKTAGVLKSLVEILGKKYSNLDLLDPGVAYATGLVHDLNVTFSNYAAGGQESKEFDEFLLANRFCWETMAERVAMHSVDLEVIKLLTEGAELPNPNHEAAYVGMREVLQGDGPLSYVNIESRFKNYMQGKENLPLLLLTVSDYMTNEKNFFDESSFDRDFRVRSDDIIWRYYDKAIQEGRTPPLVGQTFYQGGLERVGLYKAIVSTLLKGDEKNIERLKRDTNFFRD